MVDEVIGIEKEWETVHKHGIIWSCLVIPGEYEFATIEENILEMMGPAKNRIYYYYY